MLAIGGAPAMKQPHGPPMTLDMRALIDGIHTPSRRSERGLPSWRPRPASHRHVGHGLARRRSGRSEFRRPRSTSFPVSAISRCRKTQRPWPWSAISSPEN